jgi:hypothetical protein
MLSEFAEMLLGGGQIERQIRPAARNFVQTSKSRGGIHFKVSTTKTMSLYVQHAK